LINVVILRDRGKLVTRVRVMLPMP